ncbi:MAG: hypothetical protein R3B72_30585 [Polyangiaceae bacterium]
MRPKWRIGAIVLVLGGLVGCDGCREPAPLPPATAASTTPSASASAPEGSAPLPSEAPPPRPLTPLDEAARAALTVDSACLAVCRTQVQCSVSEEVVADSTELEARREGCEASCRRSRPPKEVEAQYLDQARRCLAARDCEVFSTCAFASPSPVPPSAEP